MKLLPRPKPGPWNAAQVIFLCGLDSNIYIWHFTMRLLPEQPGPIYSTFYINETQTYKRPHPVSQEEVGADVGRQRWVSCRQGVTERRSRIYFNILLVIRIWGVKSASVKPSRHCHLPVLPSSPHLNTHPSTPKSHLKKKIIIKLNFKKRNCWMLILVEEKLEEKQHTCTMRQYTTFNFEKHSAYPCGHITSGPLLHVLVISDSHSVHMQNWSTEQKRKN